MKAFFLFLKNEFDQEDIDVSPAQVRTWLASLKQAGIKGRSINRKMSSLKSFYRFLMKNGKIDATPLVNINSVKVNKRLPTFIEEKDIETLFNHVEFPDNWDGKTDRLLLNIFYQCGLRLSELINLKESQIDPGNNQIKVLGKGNKERIIPLNNQLLAEIQQYKKDKAEAFEKGEDILLVNSKGKKLLCSNVYKTVNIYLSMVSTNEKKSPHVLRHSFATHLTNHGADINAIKELLGHSSLASTQVYTSNSIEKLKDIHKQAHPKA